MAGPTGAAGSGEQPNARVFRDGNLVVNNAADVLVPFDAELWDVGGFHSNLPADQTRLTAPVSGLYYIETNLRLTAGTGAAGARRVVEIRRNGAQIIGAIHIPDAPVDTDVIVATLFRLDAGDFVEVNIFQTSGGPISVVPVGSASPHFMIVKVSDIPPP
jgi:hypothetical protein